MLLARSQASLMGKMANNCAHREISHDKRLDTGGRGGEHGRFCDGRESLAIFAMRDTWLRANITQHNAMSISISNFSTFANSTGEHWRMSERFCSERTGVGAGSFTAQGSRIDQGNCPDTP